MATRRYMTFLAQSWSDLTPAEQATWKTHPAIETLTPYHVYLKENANRYKNVHGNYLTPNVEDVFPTPTWPATRDTSEGIFTVPYFSRDRANPWLQFRINPFDDCWCFLAGYIPTDDRHNTYPRLAHIELVTDNLLHNYYMVPAPDWAWQMWTCRVSRTGKTSTVRYNYWPFN